MVFCVHIIYSWVDLYKTTKFLYEYTYNYIQLYTLVIFIIYMIKRLDIYHKYSMFKCATGIVMINILNIMNFI